VVYWYYIITYSTYYIMDSLLRNVHSDFIPVLNWIVRGTCLFYVFIFWDPYTFWILISCWKSSLQIFYHSVSRLFLCWLFPLLCKSFLVWLISFVYFTFVACAFGVLSKKSCPNKCFEVSSLCFPLIILWLQVLYLGLWSI
jgi:hypothetical protein